MITRQTCIASLGLLFTVACGGDPTIVSAVASPSTIAAGGTITMTVVVENFTLGEAEGSGLTARGLRQAHGEEAGGHIHTYLDDTETNPLAQTSSTTYPVLIPLGTTAGAHNLILRLAGADHLTLQPEVKASVAITVQ